MSRLPIAFLSSIIAPCCLVACASQQPATNDADPGGGSGGGGGGSGGWMQLPLQTWVAIPSPTRLGDGSYGGACTDGGCKHIRVTFAPTSDCSYWEGGDDNSGSSNQEVWKLCIQDGALDWNLEQPYCAPAGQIQPSRNDEIGFSYDTKRNLFWMIPGYQANPGQDSCDASAEIKGKVMTFDPASQQWAIAGMTDWDAEYDAGHAGGTQKWTQYDPVTDTLFASYYNGVAHLYHVDDGTVETLRFTTDSNGVDVSDANFSWTYSAVDLDARVIYLMDPDHSKFYEYLLDTHELRYLGDTPVPVDPGPYGNLDQMILWDSVNKVVLWNYRAPVGADGCDPQIRTFAYHPMSSTWDELSIPAPVDLDGQPVTGPDGHPLKVQGRVGIYDPSQNLMLITGTGQESSCAIPYVFVYRYGNG